VKKTTNYQLNKIELTDSPPDITVLNPNWDTIDQKMKENEEIETGQRTINQSSTPSGNTGTLQNILNGFANRIRAITGKTNWWSSPDITLADTKTHVDATTEAHGGIVASSEVVTTAQANKILKLNAQGKLPASITGDADTLDNYHASDFYRFVAKRDANGSIIYTLEASNLSEEKHNKGLQYENASGTGEFNMRLIVSPSYKKRFLKITFDMWEEQANFNFSLVNVNTGEILFTTSPSPYSQTTWQEAVFTTDSIVINPGASVTFKIIYNWYRSYKYGDIVIGGIRNLRAYMEDMELK